MPLLALSERLRQSCLGENDLRLAIGVVVRDGDPAAHDIPHRTPLFDQGSPFDQDAPAREVDPVVHTVGLIRWTTIESRVPDGREVVDPGVEIRDDAGVSDGAYGKRGPPSTV